MHMKSWLNDSGYWPSPANSLLIAPPSCVIGADRHRDAVEHRVAGRHIHDELAGQRVGVDARLLDRDPLPAAGVAPAVRQAHHARPDLLDRFDVDDQLAGGRADDRLLAEP